MISNSYIRMCEKAEKIQKAWKPKTYDYVAWKSRTFKNKYYTDRVTWRMNTSKVFWLPTQEQLQEMTMYQDENDIPAMKRSMYLQLEVFTNWALKQQYIFSTLQELWLAFVMKEKYNKSWLPKEQRWVKNV